MRRLSKIKNALKEAQVVECDVAEVSEAMKRLAEAKELAAKAKALEESARSLLESRVASLNIDTLVTSDQILSIKYYDESSYLDSKKLRAELPKVWQQYQATKKAYRTYSIKTK